MRDDAFRDNEAFVEGQQINQLFATQNERARFLSGAYVAGRASLASLFIFGGLMFFRAPTSILLVLSSRVTDFRFRQFG